MTAILKSTGERGFCYQDDEFPTSSGAWYFARKHDVECSVYDVNGRAPNWNRVLRSDLVLLDGAK